MEKVREGQSIQLMITMEEVRRWVADGLERPITEIGPLRVQQLADGRLLVSGEWVNEYDAPTT